jgi:hypothetical protein
MLVVARGHGTVALVLSEVLRLGRALALHGLLRGREDGVMLHSLLVEQLLEVAIHDPYSILSSSFFHSG